MKQAVLFSTGLNEPETPALARSTHPESSRIAAEEFTEVSLNDHEDRLMTAAQAFRRVTGGDFTQYELEAFWNARVNEVAALDHHQIVKRFAGLERKGLLERSCLRECSVCGRKLQGWRVK